MDLAVQQGDGGRRGPGRPHLGLHLPGQVQVFRPRQAVGDHGRFQRHQGRPNFSGFGH